MGCSAEQYRSKHRLDGIQLADVQRGCCADDDSAAGAAGEPRAAAFPEPRRGSPSDPFTRKSVRIDGGGDRKSTRLNSSHSQISYAVFCFKKKTFRLHGQNLYYTTRSIQAPVGQ